jgi:sugar phosphate permease
MKPQVPILLGVAGILAAIGTAIANANGLFVGHPHLAYVFYTAAFILIAVSIIGWIANKDRRVSVPDVSLVWDWSDEQKLARPGLGLTESSKSL